MLIPLHSSYLKKEQVYPHIINMYEEKSSKTFYTLFISLIHSYFVKIMMKPDKKYVNTCIQR